LASKLARNHREVIDLLCRIEVEKYGFEFAQTDDDQIIDTLNYGTSSLSFEGYQNAMKDYKKENKLRKH